MRRVGPISYLFGLYLCVVLVVMAVYAAVVIIAVVVGIWLLYAGFKLLFGSRK